ncbi:hypothetical protein ACGFMK_05050 [Amycolatopsis sp. NPDC049252]|uniref:hypothetical protein n=1 Tax=Amycolatopsis sp. NPDC049252 TaxID=3363933 RepID=UPI003716A10B
MDESSQDPAPSVAEPTPPRRVREFVPVLLVTLASVATLASGFLPLFRTEQTSGDGHGNQDVLRYTQDGWTTVFGDVGSQPSEPLGVALLAAAAALLATLVLVIRQVVLGRVSAVARGLTLGATTFLAGVVLTTVMACIPVPVERHLIRLEASPAAGMWLLFIAVAAAAAATVLGHLASPDPGAAHADTPVPAEERG